MRPVTRGSRTRPARSNNSVYDVTELSSTGSFLSGTSGYTTASLNEPYGIAIDHSGNAWVTNFTGNSVTRLSPSGANLSGTSGYTGTLDEPDSVAIDAFGSAWVTSFDLLLTEFSNTGSELSPGFEGYNGGGILEPSSVAIDGSNRAWVANDGFLGLNPTPAIAVFSGTGAPLTGSGITGGGLDDPTSIAMDSAGNAWISDYYSGVIEVNQSAPVPLRDKRHHRRRLRRFRRYRHRWRRQRLGLQSHQHCYHRGLEFRGRSFRAQWLYQRPHWRVHRRCRRRLGQCLGAERSRRH